MAPHSPSSPSSPPSSSSSSSPSIPRLPPVTSVPLEIPRRAGGTLQALHYHPGEAPAPGRRPLVVMCHGFTGDKLEWGRFPRSATVLGRAGYETVVFDFSGSGDNPREPVTLTRQVRDLEDVGAWAVAGGYAPPSTIGLSFGGITSLLADLPGRPCAVFWAPGFFMKRIIGRVAFALARFLLRLKRAPVHWPPSGDSQVLLDRTFFEAIRRHPPEPALATFQTPALVVQGLADPTVKPPLTRAAFACMPADEHHRLVEVPGATHDFDGPHLETFLAHTMEWLARYQPPPGSPPT